MTSNSPAQTSPTVPQRDDDELAFWRDWFMTKGGRWPEQYTSRQDPNLPLHWEFFAALGTPEGGTANILDVGAGPLTWLGKVWPGRKVNITAVDALAKGYDGLLAEHGITPLVRTQYGDATNLVEQFGRDRFDLVHGRNAIDHTVDAPKAVREMFAVARPGGAVYLGHKRNEGEFQRYAGMHRWNFDGVEIGGRIHFVVWNPTERIDITEELGDTATVQVTLLPEWLNVLIRKHPA
jgi:SAM-dependent methyltransferase